MKRLTSLLLAALLLILSAPVRGGAESESVLTEAVLANVWYQDEHAQLKVGNPTPMEGKFFTTMWGGSTSDLDVQDLLHAASPVLWDEELDRFRYDESVVEDALAMDDADGNRIYLIALNEELCWSDGTPITVKDYVFSMLLQMDPAVAETGGTPADYSWLAGSDAYLSGEAKALSGIRIIGNNILQVTVKAEAMPYFYELNRLNIHPYPIGQIAPGSEVRDDGEGVYLTKPLTAETLRQTVLDEKTGYLSHPRVVSGPYMLESFDGETAHFVINPYFKSTEDGMIPRIGRIEYSTADSAELVAQVVQGNLDLADKITPADAIRAGIGNLQEEPESLAMENEPRTGLTLLWFMEQSKKVQDTAVRQAIACCFDRDAFVRKVTGGFGLRADGFYGLGEWMYRMAAGMAEYPERLPEEATDEEKQAYEAAIAEWQSLSLNGLTLYEPGEGKARRRLETAGWTLNENGERFDPERDTVRYKRIGDELIGLNLKMAVPEKKEALETLEETLGANLRQAGIGLTMEPVGIERLEAIYDGREESEYDLLYLGENFSIIFDPQILAPQTENSESELCRAKEAIYAQALEMVRTEPEDLIGFVKKWVKLQEMITEDLPLLPVYTNVYFDFFTRRLHGYKINAAVTWGEAIVRSYMSDIEEMDEEEMEKVIKEIEEGMNNE